MAENKTRPNKGNVKKFLAGIEDEARRKDCLAVAGMMEQITKTKPKLWGPSLVGYGEYRYRYESGREGD